MRAPAAIALLGLLLAAACNGPARDGGPPEGPPDLDGCPRGDAPWREAIDRAERTGTLPGLESRLEVLARRCVGRWEPLWAGAECRLRAGAAADAERLYRQARERAAAANDPAGMARAADGLAWLAYARGDLGAGERFYREAIEAARRAGRDDLEGFSLANYAGLLVQRGDLARAGEMLERAAPRLAASGRPEAARRLAFNRASLMIDLGDAERARASLERLHEEARGAGDARLASFVALALGNLHRQRGEIEAALDWLGRVGDADPQSAALAALQRGRARLERGEVEAAREELARARAIARERGFPVAGLFAEVYEAAARAAAGDPAGAARALDALAGRAERDALFWPHWVARWQQGRALIAAGRPGEAVDALRASVDRLEQAGRALDPLGEGLRFLLERREPYADLAWALAATGAPAADVLAVVERAHARALRRLAGGVPPKASAEPHAIARSLGPGERLVDYLLGRERGVAVVIGPGRASVVTLPGRRRLDPLLHRYRAALRAPLVSLEARFDPRADLARGLAAGRALRRALIDPLEAALSGARRLFVVPDGPLALLPLAALPEEAGDAPSFLGERLEIARLPHAGVPARIALEGPVLLAGDPLPDVAGRFAPLPRAGAELAALHATWGVRGTLVSGADLEPERLRALPLERFRLIHLATHALAGTRDPRRSALVLSRGARLDLAALSSVRLGGALVVLSACRTAEGELVPGEGIVGLTWALLGAGASGVVASLWSVDDASAAALMAAFHARLAAGADPVTALAEASRAEARRLPHPAYWAPFVVTLRATAPAGTSP